MSLRELDFASIGLGGFLREGPQGQTDALSRYAQFDAMQRVCHGKRSPKPELPPAQANKVIKLDTDKLFICDIYNQ
jgi:hypothetical protein